FHESSGPGVQSGSTARQGLGRQRLHRRPHCRCSCAASAQVAQPGRTQPGHRNRSCQLLPICPAFMLTRLLKDGCLMLWPVLVAAGVSQVLKTSWPLLATLGALLGWQIWQKWRLARWLQRGKLLDPPFAGGLWEDYYTRLMHLFRTEQRAQQSLTSVIEQARHWADALDEGILLL